MYEENVRSTAMKKKIKVKKNPRIFGKMLFLLAVLGFGFFFFTDYVFAASDEEIISVLSNNSDLFENNGIFISAFRNLGWVIIKLLVKLSDAAEGIFNSAFGFVDFTKYEPVKNFITSFRPVFVALVCLSFVVLGITLILHHEKKPKLVINICIAVLVVSGSTEIIDRLNSLITPEVRSEIISGSESDQNVTYQIVSNSIYDLKYLDTHIGLMNVTPDNRARRDVDSGQFSRIEIDEIVKPDDVSEDSKDLVQKRLTTDGDGNDALEDVNDGVAWTDFLNTYYFRYQVSWLQCMIALLSLIIVYICLAYKTVRILYEIVIHQLMAYLYSANLTDNQKIVKILNSIKDSYITLFLVVICMKIYLLAYTFINGLEFGELTKAFLLLFVALAVIDGPNIIQKITGIDAGMTDGTHKLIAGLSGARMAAGAVKGGVVGGAKTLHGAGKVTKSSWESGKSAKQADLMDAALSYSPFDADGNPKENAGGAMPGSISNSDDNSTEANGNANVQNSKNNSETLNEGGTNLQAGDISNENNVDGSTGGSSNTYTGIDENGKTVIGDASQLGVGEGSQAAAGGETMVAAGEGTLEDSNLATGEGSQTDLGGGAPEGSGFAEGEATPQSVGEEESAQSAFDGMAQNTGIDPLTGESNGSNDLSRMEEELSQNGLNFDSGLKDSDPITYGGSMMNGMDNLAGTTNRREPGREPGRDIETSSIQSLSNISEQSRTNPRSSLASTSYAGSIHIDTPSSNGSNHLGSRVKMKPSGHRESTHGDLKDKANLENI